jgi:membrane protease YdiL (CAAX protease family)
VPEPEPHFFDHEPPAWVRNVSGLAWAVVFFLLTFVLWQLIGWALQGALAGRIFQAAMPLLLANLLTSFVLPRPEGVPRRGGLGLGGRRAPQFLLGGFALTAAGAAGLLLVLAAVGEIEIVRASSAWRALPGTLATLALAALGEELFFRGYGFQQLGRAMTPTGAALFTGLAFGFLHGRNPEVSELAVLNTVLFGVLFGLCLTWSRSFWLPYGMHFGWNFALAILGAPISGIRIKETGLETVAVGSPLWDGGAYGPEGGLAAALVVLLFALIVWKFAGAETGGLLIWEDAPPAKGE